MGLGSVISYLWSFADFYSIVILVTVYWLTTWLMWHGWLSRKNLAPGFFGFPVVSVVPYFYLGEETVYRKFERFSKKYGPVIR